MEQDPPVAAGDAVLLETYTAARRPDDFEDAAIRHVDRAGRSRRETHPASRRLVG